MRCRDNFHPLVDRYAPRGYLVPEVLVQHFCRRSWQAAHTSVPQSLKVFPDRTPGANGPVENFLRGKTVDVHVRQRFLNGSAKPDVQIPLHLRRQTSLDADFCRAVVPSLLGSPNYFLDWEIVALFFAEVAAESAEPTTLDANVGEIYVSIYYVSYDISDRAPPQFIGHQHNGVVLRTSGAEQKSPFLGANIFSAESAVKYSRNLRVQRFGKLIQACHGGLLS
jgi:hypothetical protein